MGDREPVGRGEVRNFGRSLPEGWMGLDVGPGTAAAFGDVLGDARTILWNGPMGVFEDPRFEAGTRAVAEAVAESRGFSVIGGGDSAAAIAQFGLSGEVDHISTGGGASPELIEQGDLPGLAALRSAPNAVGRQASRVGTYSHDGDPIRAQAVVLWGVRGAQRHAHPHRTTENEADNEGVDMADPRKPIISGNWKMHHNHFEAIQTVQKLHYRLESDDYRAVEVTVHPPFTDIRSIQTLIEGDKMKIGLGAQNCHWEEKGAFTGEIAPAMLAKLDVGYVIVGHSERRELFGETDESVNKKVKAVIANKMVPIMCCGETLDERESGTAEAKVEGRCAMASQGCRLLWSLVWWSRTSRSGRSAPVRPPPAQDAQAMCAKVRDVVRDVHGAEAAAGVRVQYGGSVKPGNIAELMGQSDIDGALVGGASLNADEVPPRSCSIATTERRVGPLYRLIGSVHYHPKPWESSRSSFGSSSSPSESG
ncbi:MAG: triose-phosphate isomerase [Microthrixaceae bacterium]|nr:triose-phosphate isomerase [Microthrixaceae bacterium]